MKKVLIIGVKGNLGIQLQKIFEESFEVVAWDKEELDITDEGEVNKKVKKLKPNIIINSAAYNAVDKCEEDDQEFELAKKINGLGPKYLAKISQEIKATLVHYSSDYVFDGNKKEGYSEDDETSPINNYGRSKLLGEELVQEVGKNGNLNYYIIRTSKLFGKPGLSEVAKKSFFDVMIGLSKGRDELKIVDEEVSLFTYTVDLAKATKKLIEDKKERGIYHVANSESCTWYESAKYLFEIIKRDVKIIPVDGDEFPRPAKRPKYSVLLNTKLKPIRSWKEALKDYLNI
jgi:dTDP-4-dehydrorhamnose reductase